MDRSRRKNRKKERKNKLLFVFTISFFFFLAVSVVGAYLMITEPIINPLSKNNTKTFEKINKILKSRNISYSKIEQNNDLSYKISLKDNGDVYISYKKDLGVQIDSLQLIVSRLTIEGKRFKSLDFRFDKPVVTY